MAAITENAEPTKSSDHHLYSRIRLVTKPDIPSLHKLLHKMAEFHNVTGCKTTESSLSSILFNPDPPFPSSFTANVNVFILEVSPTPLSNHNPTSPDHFSPINRTFHLLNPIVDPEESGFITEEGTVIAGFVLFFPIYDGYVAKPGFRIQDLFVRECYRSKGFGELLMKAVANLAVKLGYGKLEWSVVNWNEGAIKFYERMGARDLKNWRSFELTNDSLQACGKL